MTIDISRSTHYLLTSAVASIRNQYDGVRLAINAEPTTGTYSCPVLLPENAKTTTWPNPPGGGSSWVGLMVTSQAEQQCFAITRSRTMFALRAICGVRSSNLRTDVTGVVDDPDLTGQDTGWHSACLMSSCVATVLGRHLTDFDNIVLARLKNQIPLENNTTGGNDTFVYQIDMDVLIRTYNAALTT